jgi:hypothetical protein
MVVLQHSLLRAEIGAEPAIAEVDDDDPAGALAPSSSWTTMAWATTRMTTTRSKSPRSRISSTTLTTTISTNTTTDSRGSRLSLGDNPVIDVHRVPRLMTGTGTLRRGMNR